MKITVDGREYDSWDDLPEDLRATLAANPMLRDADHDGVPDGLAALMQAARDGNSSGPITTTSTVVTIDGKTYASLEEVPAHLRAALEAAGVFGGSPTGTPAPARQAPGQPAAPMPTFAADRSVGGPMPGTLINGLPIDADPSARRKRWWRRD